MIESGKNLYYIAVIPKGDLLEELSQIKEEFSRKFNARHALKSPPHITLHMPFKWRADREESLITHLSGINFKRFEIHLENFGAFVPKVIYMSVKESIELRELYEQVRLTARNHLKLDNSSYKDLGFNPHLTIAHRDLKRADFETAWKKFQLSTYSAIMQIESFWLLKHDGKKWQPFKEYFGSRN